MRYQIVLIVVFIAYLFSSCAGKRIKLFQQLRYHQFKDSIILSNHKLVPDTSNVLENPEFIPAKDSVNILLSRITTAWQNELQAKHSGKNYSTAGDTAILIENLKEANKFMDSTVKPLATECRELSCPVYAEVVKSVQKLYLYLDGVLSDSFPVSTGIKGYITPGMNTRASGPMFIKYTSKKFPGGNYEGLGNMPYAVFIRGGYAIHGTTPGNFSKLGEPASHGCIRLHPDNARIFYELVKVAGLQNTWVKVTDSLQYR